MPARLRARMPAVQAETRPSGSAHSSSGRTAQTSVSAPSSATFVPNSVVCRAISSVDSSPMPIA